MYLWHHFMQGFTRDNVSAKNKQMYFFWEEEEVCHQRPIINNNVSTQAAFTV
jgi:hypothetical protein